MHVSRRSTAVLVGALALVLPAAAAATVQTDTLKIRRGLTAAEQARWLTPSDASLYRALVGRAAYDARRLPKLRGVVIRSQLDELAGQSGSYISPRALALFSMLKANLDYLETHILPRKSIDIAGDEGVVYRWFGLQGFQFHPLAEFGALNAAVSGVDPTTVRQLADALVARAVPRGSAFRWEYYFHLGVGRPPWLSGMAQAVAAQALGRSGTMLDDPALLQAARRAYAAVRGSLLLELSPGPWIRLYGFNHEVVLNAQLQTILSLYDYADATGDASAAALATRLTATARTLLPRFDTGSWSRYELGGPPASYQYEQYVTRLLIKLGQRTGDPFWQEAAARFYAYMQPPRIVPAPEDAPVTLYPQPADGYLDSAPVQFSLSKRARVTLTVAGVSVTRMFYAGDHVLVWNPGDLPPGTYNGRLTAVDVAGKKTTVPLPQPFVIAVDEAPQIQAQLQDGLLTWQGIDPGTPKLRLALLLTDPTGATGTLHLGPHSVSGSLNVTLPSGSWDVALTATNTTGFSTSVALGQIVVP